MFVGFGRLATNLPTQLTGIDLNVRTPLFSGPVNLCDQFCAKLVR
jgi:hypothetical protein